MPLGSRLEAEMGQISEPDHSSALNGDPVAWAPVDTIVYHDVDPGRIVRPEGGRGPASPILSAPRAGAEGMGRSITKALPALARRATEAARFHQSWLHAMLVTTGWTPNAGGASAHRRE